MVKPLLTFFYHNSGQDNNGNDGPMPNEPGWLVCVGRTAEEAVKQLPPKAQRKIAREMKRAIHEDPSTDLVKWVALTCTWGWNFSFLNEANWRAVLELNEDAV